MSTVKMRPYMNPYLAGFLLGIVLLVTIYITGRGLGASGGLKAVALSGVKLFQAEHWENAMYYSEYVKTHEGSPLNTWLFYEVIGVVLGAFFSGIISERLGFRINKGPNITNKTRLMAAGFGGLLFGLGSQFGRGCTSGAALSGMAVLSTAGFISMLAIFGTAYIFAYFFRKLWI